jgi:endonuclease/exonuclease/phosphatase family metal-dependent hydrolase
MRELKVLSLNINTGHGPSGDFWQRIGRRDLLDNLDAISDLIRRSDADVACLQEVDIRWQRTHDINQAAFIASRCGLPNAHYHPHLRSPLPGPFRRLTRFPDNIVVNRDLGTAILSRYPMAGRRHYDFGQSLTGSRSVNYFARLLNEAKGYSFAEIRAGQSTVGVMNVHLLNDIVYQVLNYLGKQVRGQTFERAWQAEKLLEHAREYVRDVGRPLVVAGDFNTVPREGQLQYRQSRNGDPDDYRRDVTMHLMRESGLIRTIPELFGAGDGESIRPFHTYPGIEPDRTLDYIFVSAGMGFVDYRVYGQAVSDHLAVVATIALEGLAAS